MPTLLAWIPFIFTTPLPFSLYIPFIFPSLFLLLLLLLMLPFIFLFFFLLSSCWSSSSFTLPSASLFLLMLLLLLLFLLPHATRPHTLRPHVPPPPPHLPLAEKVNYLVSVWPFSVWTLKAFSDVKPIYTDCLLAPPPPPPPTKIVLKFLHLISPHIPHPSSSCSLPPRPPLLLLNHHLFLPQPW